MDGFEYEPMDTTQSPKDRISEYLSKVERHVETLRREAFVLEGIRNRLTATLDSLKCNDLLTNLGVKDYEEMTAYVDRVAKKCLTVHVSVRTMRSTEEEDALYNLNGLIDDLIVIFRENRASGRNLCESYLAACFPIQGVTPNRKFQLMLQKCTLDDQKIIASRIEGLLNYLDGFNKLTVSEID